MDVSDNDHGDDEHFRLKELDPLVVERLTDGKVRVFLIRVKTDSDIGHQFENNPLPILRRRIPEIGKDWTASVFRIRGEVPVNRVHSASLWITIPERKHAMGVNYKFQTAPD
ncbi:MAG TPA: hypothetical protein VE777_07805 [Gaiellales bacterium]|jgi:hypothetical protein|nr:hypothetical protein [Gaiellales bacterium]